MWFYLFYNDLGHIYPRKVALAYTASAHENEAIAFEDGLGDPVFIYNTSLYQNFQGPSIAVGFLFGWFVLFCDRVSLGRISWEEILHEGLSALGSSEWGDSLDY